MTKRTAGAGALALLCVAFPAYAQDHTAHQHEAPMAPMTMPSMNMSGALGPYAMAREASGTSWQPDTSLSMAHTMSGPWTFMNHAVLNGVYDWQGGPRGDDDVFVSGMLMTAARRGFENGATVNFRAMVSPDPLMGKRGYPLLLAAGETADGVTSLVDRQHPHDLVMELAASVSAPVGQHGSVFLYGGLPGEPAFGPPAFMHRLSIMDSPEAPISHHWLDSTHITFGVVTAGYVRGNWKIEASRFRGREPDEDRYDIESPDLGSTSLRLSWNPAPQLSLQVSWAEVRGPEQLEPDEIQKRWSASAIYTVPFGRGGRWSTTAAWGRKVADGHHPDAFVLESALKPDLAWTFFTRAEWIESDELFVGAGSHHGPEVDVGKVSVGAVHDWRLSGPVTFGVGGLMSFNRIPQAFEGSYGGDRKGAMVFARIKIY